MLVELAPRWIGVTLVPIFLAKNVKKGLQSGAGSCIIAAHPLGEHDRMRS